MALPQPGRMSGVAPAHVRHKPEQALLYQLVEQYWPEFQTQLSETGRFLPRHVTREFEDYLACGRLENGFLRVRCESCSHEHLVAFSCKRRGFRTSCGARRMVETAALLVDHVLPHRAVRQWVLSFPYPLRFVLANHPEVMGKVLAIVNRAISTYLINKAGFKISQAHTGAVTLVQRFGSALNLNLHFHMLFIDGVFSPKSNGQLRFHRVNAPTSKELNALVATISERVARYLERQGWLARDEQSDHLTLALDDEEGNTMQQLQGHSITYRIAMGPQAGRKVLTLQTIPAWGEDDYGNDKLGRIGGFSLHAGVAVNTRERKKLERICRYISRPALSEARLELTDQGMVRYALKTAYRDGTKHVVFEPLDFMAKLAALVPRPRTNLTRFHGVLAPNSRYRKRITPTRSVKVKETTTDEESDGREELDQTAGKRKGMCWAQRLKRVFNIDVSICSACGGPMRIIASCCFPHYFSNVFSIENSMREG